MKRKTHLTAWYPATFRRDYCDVPAGTQCFFQRHSVTVSADYGKARITEVTYRVLLLDCEAWTTRPTVSFCEETARSVLRRSSVPAPLQDQLTKCYEYHRPFPRS